MEVKREEGVAAPKSDLLASVFFSGSSFFSASAGLFSSCLSFFSGALIISSLLSVFGAIGVKAPPNKEEGTPDCPNKLYF